MKFLNEFNNSKPTVSTIKMIALYLAVIGYFILVIPSLVSCSSDDSPTPPISEEEEEETFIFPTVVLHSGETDVHMGVVGGPTSSALVYEVKATAPDGYDKMTIYKVVDGTEAEYQTVDTIHPNYVAGSNTFTYTLNYILNEDDVDKDLLFRAVVTDINGNTDSLDFAAAQVALPMIQGQALLQTSITENGDVTLPCYLYIDEAGSMVAVNHETAAAPSNNSNVLFAFTLSETYGYNLSSINSVEDPFSNNFNLKTSTELKEQVSGSPFDISLPNTYNIYDVYNIEHIFSILDFNTHNEKAENVNTIGKRFFFETDDNRTGVLQVSDFEILGSRAYLEIDVFLTN